MRDFSLLINPGATPRAPYGDDQAAILNADGLAEAVSSPPLRRPRRRVPSNVPRAVPQHEEDTDGRLVLPGLPLPGVPEVARQLAGPAAGGTAAHLGGRRQRNGARPRGRGLTHLCRARGPA